MHPAYEHATADLITLAAPHEHSHRCHDGVWYPTNVREERCPTWKQLAHVTEQVTDLAWAPRHAADDPEAVRAVVEGMTGLVMADVDAESREGWQVTGRMAIIALAAHLSGAPA